MATLRRSSWVLDAVGAGPEFGAPHVGQGEDSALTECGAAELRAVRVQGGLWLGHLADTLPLEPTSPQGTGKRVW